MAKTTSAPKAAAAPAAQANTVPISVDAVVWVVLIGLAAGLRLAGLDTLPLSADESSRAFAAWVVSEGTVPDGWTGDLTSALTSHLFRIFDASDPLARLLPALAGSALVASFWWAGRYFGRGVALLAGLLVALSPVAVLASRSALGFAAGGAISMLMLLSLLAYVRQPRPWPAVGLAAGLGLALGSDSVAATTAIALGAFVAVEWAWRRDEPVAEAVATLRSTREHWQPAALALVAALILAVAQYGTDVERLRLAGLQEWVEMFGLPRDGLPWHYQLSVLTAYELPLLLAGAAGYLVLADRWIGSKSPPPLAQRLLMAWATVAILSVAFATQRQSGQMLVLLLPFSLLAATLVEEVASSVDWSVLRRWWLVPLGALALATYGLLQLTHWAHNAASVSDVERVYLILALIGAALIVAGGLYYLGRNGLALALPVLAALALPFSVHSSLSVAFDDGTEFAAAARPADGMLSLRAAVRAQAEETRLPVAIDPDLRDALGWSLRDEPVAFGDPATGAAFVLPSESQPPAGYEAPGGPLRVAEGWAPDSLEVLPAWRWFVYREAYGNLSTTDVILLTPSE
jgi:4-amino-4-deoxy-L-arabinose transferase-like glycosyltransferase